MRYYLCLLMFAVCEARRITRGVDFTHYPNTRTIFHGDGAVSYQNVQIDHHDSIPLPANYIDKAEIQELEYAHHHDSRPFIPVEEPHNEIDYTDVSNAATLEDLLITEVDVKPNVFKSLNYYDDEYNYDLHK